MKLLKLGKTYKQAMTASHSLDHEAVGHDNGIISLSAVETDEPNNMATHSPRHKGLRTCGKDPCSVNWLLKALDMLGYHSKIAVSAKDWKTVAERQALLRELGMKGPVCDS